MKTIDEPGVLEALQAIRAEAARLERDDYKVVSVRSLWHDLELTVPLAKVLAACAEGGFTYCLDYTIPIRMNTDSGTHDHPHQDTCYWGADQLRSRLDTVDWRICHRGK